MIMSSIELNIRDENTESYLIFCDAFDELVISNDNVQCFRKMKIWYRERSFFFIKLSQKLK